jgi:hypothetical protein
MRPSDAAERLYRPAVVFLWRCLRYRRLDPFRLGVTLLLVGLAPALVAGIPGLVTWAVMSLAAVCFSAVHFTTVRVRCPDCDRELSVDDVPI